MRQSCESAKLGWEYSFRDNFLHFAQPGVYPNFFRNVIFSSVAQDVLPRVQLMDRLDSRLDVEHQARHLSTLLRPTESPLSRPDHPSSLVPASPSRPLDLITRPSPFRATMCSSVWKRFPNHVPKCHLSVMRPPGTFPAALNITEAPNCRSSPRCGRFFNLSYADFPSLAT